MVHSGYHPLKDPVRIVFGWCTVDIIFLRSSFRIVFGWCTVDIILLKDRPGRIVFGWCTVDIILRIVPQHSVWSAQWS